MSARAYTPREAYEEDCRRNPLYHDGGVRRSWDELGREERGTWVRNPWPREPSPTAPAISKSEETR